MIFTEKSPEKIVKEDLDAVYIGNLNTVEVHMARPNGRFCGAKRPKCEAEQPLGFD